ncbi:MAG: PfkB family carbohydrate kinase [Fimbriimonadaceae bacterium]
MLDTHLLEEIEKKAPTKGDVVFVSGNFNILHPGHLRLLQFAKECGDFLVVGVNSNRIAGRAAILDESLRLEALLANTSVDHTFILDMSAEKFAEQLKPKVIVKGKEHEGKVNAEAAVVAKYGGRLVFGSGDTVFSASNLLREELKVEGNLDLEFPAAFAGRHGISMDTLQEFLRRAQEARICVIGDVIVDEYINCEPLGMSQEDPTVVVTPIGQQSFLGGAGIVAAHCAGMGAKVSYFTVTGDDVWHDFALEKLRQSGVDVVLLKDDTRPTTTKQRYRAKGKTLLRVNHLRQHGISKELQEQLLESLLPRLDASDALVFSDFNYGCLPQQLVDRITAEARKRGLILMADSQCSSQVGDVTRFKQMDLLTPTEMEARVSTRDHESGLVTLAESLRRQAGAKNVFLKLGGEGMMVHAAKQCGEDWITDQLPSFNHRPKDTAGAGDSLLAAAAITLALGGDVWQASFLGSLAAACQVSRIGNTPLTPGEMLRAFDR